MYLIMRDELGQAPEGWSTFQGDLSGFRSAEDRVYEDDFEAVLTVLAGPSPCRNTFEKISASPGRICPAAPFAL